MAPDARMAAINAAQSSVVTRPSDVPSPPGMMDIEMEEVPRADPWAPSRQLVPLRCVPPSLLSCAPPNSSLSPAQLEAKAQKRAQRKAERAGREEASADDREGEKKFRCPVEGCGKVYKQANGLKYHMTRSINSGHGNFIE
jgi:transcription factor SFP1